MGGQNSRGGNVAHPAVGIDGMLARMADVWDMHPLNISTEEGDHVSGGLLRVPAWKTDEYAHAFHNPSEEEYRQVIVRNSASVSVTIQLPPGGFTPKLSRIEYIVVTGTDDGIVVITQKYA